MNFEVNGRQGIYKIIQFYYHQNEAYVIYDVYQVMENNIIKVVCKYWI